ncbi:STAS domain-containing protein [Nonomuraea aurantiaca]|uniref:STAS domain-containing protein n=1 Tax=Nonomuraea aurantiaca TaxID=2878562 RepID=UPI001CDA1024|nr:STAS domain-containing protein [Nonomuraea aurantiaca]MCA2228823.1 STAS domain-containing protein [Nonomuraea aurantiaca]
MSTKDAASAPASVIAALVERFVTALTPITTAPIRAVPVTATDQLLRITPLADRAGLWIEGELDHSTLPDLRQALGSMASGRGFCVDLSGLAFIDVGGLRALVSVAAALHDGGDHVLTLRSAPPQLRRLLQLTGWRQTPGLHLQVPTHPG